MFCKSSQGALHLRKISWKYQTVFNLQYKLEMAMCNVQRAITPKVGKSELWSMCSALCCMVLYIWVKFRENMNSIRAMERTRVHGRNGYFQYLYCSKGCNSKYMLTRVMFLMFCKSTHGALHLCEISWKYLKQFSTYTEDRSIWWKWLCSMFKGQ